MRRAAARTKARDRLLRRRYEYRYSTSMSSRSTKAAPIVRVRGTQASGSIRGTTLPFAAIDAVNLSASASQRTGFHDTVTIAHANENGAFEGTIPMRAGDVVRIRARSKRGALGEWTLFRAKGVGGSPRPPQVALFRFGLRDLENGHIHVFNLSPSRSIAAPGSTIAVKNLRTGDRVSIVPNDNGSFKRTKIPGSAGDVLGVEVKAPGGRGQARRVGTLVTPHATRTRSDERVSPWGYHQRVGFVPALQLIDAPLFAREPRHEDVIQSELPNCYLASASAAVAHVRPKFLKRAIVALGEGRYRVRFQMVDRKTGKASPRDVEVTSALYVRPSGELLYGSSEREEPQLWWPILEKAFARLRGSYREIGKGGCSDIVLQTLLGRRGRRFFVEPDRKGEADLVWTEIETALAEHRPVVAGTAPNSLAHRYRNTGVIPDHAYAVLSCRTVRGVRKIAVRNPWGEDARAPCRARRNGVLELAMPEFIRLFYVISTVR